MNKIAFVIGTMQGGGAQRVVTVLSKYFADKGYSVSIITTSDAKLDYQLDSKVRFIPLVSKYNIPLIKQGCCLANLHKELKSSQYDYISAFLPMTCIYVAVCKMLGLRFKYIASERMDPAQDPASSMLRNLRDWAYSKADGLVFQTEDAKQYFSSKFNVHSKIIFNPINDKIPSVYQGEREKRIVTAVRLEKQKNIEMLIDAFKDFHQKHPEYTLEVYGKGTLEELLNSKIKEYHLEKSFFLKGFSKNVYEDMLKASFFVLPSNYEGVSNSMLEALCMGLPVVSTDHPIGGAKMFIKDGENGYLTPVGNAEMFCQAMEKVAELDADEYRKMSNSAAAVKEILLPLKVCQEWENFIVSEI